MFDVKIEIDGLEKFEKYIKFVEAINSMKTDKGFQKFIQNKCLETVKEQSDKRITSSTTDNEYIVEYKSRHKIRETSDGFILYNDTILPVELLPVSEKNISNYANGFSIALAFEYGIGIVGQNSAKQGAWEYNVNNWNFPWYYVKYGEKYSTYGYEGFEVYRYTAEEIQKNLKNWVLEYRNKKGGVSTL